MSATNEDSPATQRTKLTRNDRRRLRKANAAEEQTDQVRGKWARSKEFRKFLFAHFKCLEHFRLDGSDSDEEGEATNPHEAPVHANNANDMPVYVLDVAGGKGDVAIPLRVSGVDCGIVDPRVVDLKNTKLMKNIAFHLNTPGTKTGDMLRRRMAERGESLDVDSATGTASLKLPDVFPEWFSAADDGDSRSLKDAKLRCDLIIGMHPDQATEPIVDFALASRKPFAIVPCCVFPRENRHRRVVRENDVSEPVESYEQFIEYLLQKAPPGTIKVATLPIDGRNTVLYCDDFKQPSNTK